MFSSRAPVHIDRPGPSGTLESVSGFPYALDSNWMEPNRERFGGNHNGVVNALTLDGSVHRYDYTKMPPVELKQ